MSQYLFVRKFKRNPTNGGDVSDITDPWPHPLVCGDGCLQTFRCEVHPIPKVDNTLAQLHVAGAKLFSKLDANSGFWQVLLAKESRPLTAFTCITPFGRYCFNKLPFGISSAPELFQRQINQILEGLEGMVCHMDDVLVHRTNKIKHDARLNAVLKRLQTAGVMLNSDECEFSKERVKFLGYVIDREGIQADPEKTTTILQMKAPTNVTELRRFFDMANQLGNLHCICQNSASHFRSCWAPSVLGHGVAAIKKRLSRSNQN